MLRAKRMRHCWFCGEPLGVYADWDQWDTCGKRECERATSESMRAEREEAHRKLDEDMGW